MSARFRVFSFVALFGASGCDPTPTPGDGGLPTSTTRLVWAPVAGAMDFGAMPFPDDLYLEDGHVEIGALPSEAEGFADYADTVRIGFRDLDGFGATTPIFFPVEGEVDAASLPATAPESTLEDASVFLVDVDVASPDAGTRIPALVRWDPARHLIAVRPWTGHPLHESRTYAAVVTSGVLGMDGLPISSAARFASVRDATARPTDALDAEAWDELAPVLPLLGDADVAGVAVFTVQSIERGLEEARAVIHEAAPSALDIRRVTSGSDLDALLGTPVIDQAGLDVEGGVQHTHIGTVISGTFESPNFLDETPSVHGRFTHDAAGALVTHDASPNEVWFTLALPAGDVSDLRVVVFQHGLGSDRSAMFSVADALCAEGWAVAAIDIPYHGMRAGPPTSVDMRHRFGTATGPDLFGEIAGGAIYNNFVGAGDTMGELSPFHPFYVRDVLRQSAADIMGLVHQLDDGDWTAIEAMGGPTSLGFSPLPMGFVGVSLGGIVGTTFVTTEPRIGAAVLNVTGGTLTALVAGSASFFGTFLPLLSGRIGLDLAAIDHRMLPPEMLPELAIYQTLLDAGDSMAYAPLLAGSERHVLFQMALDDETVPNSSTEGLARGSGAVIAEVMPRFTDLSMATYPITANVTLPTGSFTRGLAVFDPATHGLLSERMSTSLFVHPVAFPFDELPEPVVVENGVDAAVAQAVRFFATWEVGVAEIAAP